MNNQEIIEKIEAIKELEGLTIELKGVWIWVSGDTYKHKETLKELGYKFCKKDKTPYWIWHPAESKVYHRKGHKVSIEEINYKYGNMVLA